MFDASNNAASSFAGRGYLTAAELRGVLSSVVDVTAAGALSATPGPVDRPLPAETIDAIVAFADTTNSGTIDYTVFATKVGSVREHIMFMYMHMCMHILIVQRMCTCTCAR